MDSFLEAATFHCYVPLNTAYPHAVVIGVGLGGAPQAGVIHLGAFVVEFALVSEWKDAVRSFHRLTISPLYSKASMQEGKGDENALNQHDYLATGRMYLLRCQI